MAGIEIWNGDLCDLEVDEIVNAADASPWMATAVVAARKHADGDSIEASRLSG